MVFDSKVATSRAEEIYKSLGGKIFAFPIDENEVFSKYAVVLRTGEEYTLFQKHFLLMRPLLGYWKHWKGSRPMAGTVIMSVM
ncbi:hypothetical protein D3C74_185380 [compost metagenome]